MSNLPPFSGLTLPSELNELSVWGKPLARHLCTTGNNDFIIVIIKIYFALKEIRGENMLIKLDGRIIC